MKLKTTSYLYVNGLGRGKTKLNERLAFWWWRRAGLRIAHAHINWFDGQSFGAKLAQVVDQAKQLLQDSDGVVIIGSSAGGSLALNAFYKLHDEHVYAVNAHGRLKVGDYTPGSWYSLERRAYLNTKNPSQSFYDSVKYSEEKVIPNLTTADKKRLLILTQLTDLVVPLRYMQIAGVKTHRSFAFGHSGGYWAHMIADRDLISRFTIK